jgi:hypothetical protein
MRKPRLPELGWSTSELPEDPPGLCGNRCRALGSPDLLQQVTELVGYRG